MFIGETAEELPYHCQLFFGEIGEVVELMQVAHVGQHLSCVSHVLIDIIEVGKEQFAPSIEMVECLFRARTLSKRLMQSCYELDIVGHLER